MEKNNVVDFKYWFDNILAAAKLIASETDLRRAWIQGDAAITSAYDPNELLEHLLGDLRVAEHVQMFGDNLREKGAYESVATFAGAVLDVESAIRSEPSLENPENLLVSPVWTKLRGAAKSVLERRD